MHTGYAINEWHISALSTLINSPKGGKCLVKYLPKVYIFCAAVMQIYGTMNVINRYMYPECDANKQAV